MFEQFDDGFEEVFVRILLGAAILLFLFLWVRAVIDAFIRRPDLSVGGKAAWAIGMLIFPFIGLLVLHDAPPGRLADRPAPPGLVRPLDPDTLSPTKPSTQLSTHLSRSQPTERDRIGSTITLSAWARPRNHAPAGYEDYPSLSL